MTVGYMVSWFHGFVGAWFRGFMVSVTTLGHQDDDKFHGFVVAWFHPLHL